MKNNKRISLLVLVVFLIGLACPLAVADGGSLMTLTENQKLYIEAILIMQVEGAFERWELSDQQVLVKAMLDYGIYTTDETWDELFPEGMSDDEIAAQCDAILQEHYGETAFGSFLPILDYEWPENARMTEDQQWYNQAVLAASEYGDTLTDEDYSGRAPIATEEEAIEKARSTMTEIYSYTEEELTDFIFSVDQVEMEGQSEQVWRIQCYPADDPASVYISYFAQNGTFITAQRP